MPVARSVFRLAAIFSALTLLAGFVSFRAGAFNGFTQHLRAAARPPVSHEAAGESSGLEPGSLSLNEVAAKPSAAWTGPPNTESVQLELLGSPKPAFVGKGESAFFWPPELEYTPAEELELRTLQQVSPRQAKSLEDGELPAVIAVSSAAEEEYVVEPLYLTVSSQPENPSPVMVSTKSAVMDWSPPHGSPELFTYPTGIGWLFGGTPLPKVEMKTKVKPATLLPGSKSFIASPSLVKDLTPLHLTVFSEYQSASPVISSSKSLVMDWSSPHEKTEPFSTSAIETEWFLTGFGEILVNEVEVETKAKPATVLPGSKGAFGILPGGLK